MKVLMFLVYFFVGTFFYPGISSAGMPSGKLACFDLGSQENTPPSQPASFKKIGKASEALIAALKQYFKSGKTDETALNSVFQILDPEIKKLANKVFRDAYTDRILLEHDDFAQEVRAEVLNLIQNNLEPDKVDSLSIAYFQKKIESIMRVLISETYGAYVQSRTYQIRPVRELKQWVRSEQAKNPGAPAPSLSQLRDVLKNVIRPKIKKSKGYANKGNDYLDSDFWVESVLSLYENPFGIVDPVLFSSESHFSTEHNFHPESLTTSAPFQPTSAAYLDLMQDLERNVRRMPPVQRRLFEAYVKALWENGLNPWVPPEGYRLDATDDVWFGGPDIGVPHVSISAASLRATEVFKSLGRGIIEESQVVKTTEKKPKKRKSKY